MKQTGKYKVRILRTRRASTPNPSIGKMIFQYFFNFSNFDYNVALIWQD